MIYLYEKEENKKVIKSWCNNPDEGSIEQAKNLAGLPFIHSHVALMPDTHLGYGMPIGGVIACTNYIIPNAVGVDMGCGMSAIKTTFKDDIPTDVLKKIMQLIRDTIPMGFGKNQKEQCPEESMPDLQYSYFIDTLIPAARKQLGTLGSGNHFIEFQRDEENYLWIMLHSGSRNFGYKICNHYNKIAKELNKKYFSIIDPKQDLAFLPMDTDEGKDYFMDMQYATHFAYLNRQKMMFEIINIVSTEFNLLSDFKNSVINIHHNYADIEHHYGKNVYVHRKGATRAYEGELGIIPGSQGTSSYIVEGLGNPESFKSCSHGAGRRMGRKQAKRELNLKDEIKFMDDKGIIHSMRTESNLDEAASAYKDIDVVMEEQKDLVKIIHKLNPIAVLKG